MILKKFRVKLILQIIAILLVMMLLNYLIFYTELYATLLVVTVIFIIQIVYLIHYVEKTNQYLIRFFDAIKYSDFSQSFAPEGLGSSFDSLRNSFAEVINAFQHNRSEKEEQYRYLQTVIQHVGIGLLAFQRNGEVELINTAAKRLFRINHLKDIHNLENISPGLVAHLLNIKSGKKTLFKLYHNDELLQLAIIATEFKLSTRTIVLVSIQNIQGELEEKEMEAWQNLIHILTHEIMNSITPITSLSATVNQLLDANRDRQPLPEDVDDIKQALNTIHKRSEGLMRFVESYRSLTLLPKPDFQILKLNDLVERIIALQKPQLESQSIELETEIVPKNLSLAVDPEMFERVLINLIINSMHALEENEDGKIFIKAGLTERGKTFIQVIDNGPGILPEVQNRIFIPFFTTRKEGSGIGLSMCRQIVRLHNGSISVKSEPGVETVFTIII